MKKLALLDIDDTLYDGYSVVEVIMEEIKAGVLSQASGDAVNRFVEQYKAGAISYENAVDGLLKVWAEGLAGQTYDAALNAAWRVYERPEAFFPYAKPLFQKLRPTHDTYLVSAQPGFSGDVCRATLGATGLVGTEFELTDGVFTGEVERPLAHRQQKAEAVKELLERYGHEGSVGFGDSEGDIGMLELIEAPFAVSPTPGLTKEAKTNGWRIVDDHSILEAVSEAIGS